MEGGRPADDPAKRGGVSIWQGTAEDAVSASRHADANAQAEGCPYAHHLAAPQVAQRPPDCYTDAIAPIGGAVSAHCILGTP